MVSHGDTPRFTVDFFLIYHLVMTTSSPWKITMLLIGKPSISMGHGFHGYVSHNQMVSLQTSGKQCKRVFVADLKAGILTDRQLDVHGLDRYRTKMLRLVLFEDIPKK
jgi:hypothetical protein